MAAGIEQMVDFISVTLENTVLRPACGEKGREISCYEMKGR